MIANLFYIKFMFSFFFGDIGNFMEKTNKLSFIFQEKLKLIWFYNKLHLKKKS